MGTLVVLRHRLFYSSPLFRKDCPHLLKKRRVGEKAAQRQDEDKAEELGSPAEAEPTSRPPEELLAPREHQREHQREQQREPAGGPEQDLPTTQVRSESAPPAILGVAARRPLPLVLPVAELLPLCHLCLPVVAAGPVAPRPPIPPSPGPFPYCPVCHCFLGYLPPMAGRPDCPYSSPYCS
nr:heat shock transcription factor, X-linked-like [Vulpes vulpes]